MLLGNTAHSPFNSLLGFQRIQIVNNDRNVIFWWTIPLNNSFLFVFDPSKSPTFNVFLSVFCFYLPHPRFFCCRWWPITIVRLITHTHAWSQSLCTVCPLYCAELLASMLIESSCSERRTCRAYSAYAPASRTLPLPSVRESWSPSHFYAKVRCITCYFINHTIT